MMLRACLGLEHGIGTLDACLAIGNRVGVGLRRHPRRLAHACAADAEVSIRQSAFTERVPAGGVLWPWSPTTWSLTESLKIACLQTEVQYAPGSDHPPRLTGY